MKISFAAPKISKTGAVASGVLAGGKMTPATAALDKRAGGALARAIKASRFSGKAGEILEVLSPPSLGNSRVILFGIGDAKSQTDRAAEALGGSLLAKFNRVGETDAVVNIEDLPAGPDAATRAGRAGFGARLGSYRFDKYRTRESADKKPTLKTLAFHCGDPKGATRLYNGLGKVAEGVFMTRDLVSEPANIINPKSFVAEARKLSKLGIAVKVLNEAAMKKLGMGALLGVGQGSANESYLLVMEWNGAPKNKRQTPLAFVGKGVTFDTGGISIKPAGGMEDMKWDMGGAGVVAGLMRALAGRKAKVNVVGICGLVENMPSATAQRPGDIVTSANGQTIEVINTDAEGRLVLADALWYVQKHHGPRLIVDLATLTGAIIVALGEHHAGMFSNNDGLSEQLTAAGKAVGEPVWRMPLGPDYDKAIDSDAADMKNVGNRLAGSITAAQFLQRFIENDTPWAHLDIAGVTWSKRDRPTVPKGGTAFGVRLLDNFVAENFE